MQPHVRTNLLGNRAQMLMMRQVDDLADLGHFRKKPKSFLRTVIVERLHDIISDERDP